MDANGLMLISGIILFFVVVLIGFFLNFVLFIVSIFRHSISFDSVFKTSFAHFKQFYSSFFKYYIPLIVLFVISSIIGGYEWFLSTFKDASIFDTYPLYVSISIVFGFLAIEIVYYGIIDSSLLKSYHSFLSGGSRKRQQIPFTFSWVSFPQILRLIIVTILLGIVMVIGLPFFAIPTILAGYILTLVRFPIIAENKGIFESLGHAIHIFKHNFWNSLFYLGVYSAILSAFSTLIQIPFMGYVVQLFVMLAVQPCATLFLTKFYLSVENNKVEKYKSTK